LNICSFGVGFIVKEMSHRIQPIIVRFDSIDSTNSEASRQAKLGAPEGLCIIAREQTAGRGREQRVWLSPPDTGLYFSIVLRPAKEMRHWPLITLMTAVAVHDALKSAFEIACDIKWPNDIYCRGLKISGILAETAETNAGPAVVVGIGVNLLVSALSPELHSTATSVQTEIGRPVKADELLPALLETLSEFYKMFQSVKGHEAIVSEWKARSSYWSGKPVRVSLASEIFEGTTCGLEPDGALRIETADREIKIVRSGDVIAVRPAANMNPNDEPQKF
jgi:BirA family biotin operon repressor/biotin-[acetyl-CoA-carboxylase] ligase